MVQTIIIVSSCSGRFHVDSASWLSEATKASIQSQLGRELSREGWLEVSSNRYNHWMFTGKIFFSYVVTKYFLLTYVIFFSRTESSTLNMADSLQKLRVNIWRAEAATEDTFPLLEEERARKQRLKLARQRLHIKLPET